MELRTADEIRVATSGLASGNGDALDRLVWTGVFGADAVRDLARQAVLDQARSKGIYPASIHAIYAGRGRGELPLDFTVPAINIRGLAYDSARALFRARKALEAGAVIVEIARSEISYTDQRPAEYTFVMLAAALREGWKGPVFIQGDHFQVNAKKYAANPASEVQAVKDLTAEAIRAGFYNIDVDTSTLVDLSLSGHEAQQKVNGERCAEMTAYIRRLEPRGVTVSVGGEIGEVGSKNSTPEELHAFMKVYRGALSTAAPGAAGLSKISIQTGTSHGGVPLPDGTIAHVKIDFDAIESLSKLARQPYGMGGAVQHGASTLPAELFDRFPKLGACEIHLATEFQNMILDSSAFPADLKQAIYAKLRETDGGERKPTDTDEQFFYKTRKKALGAWKRELWGMPVAARQAIGKQLEDKFLFLMKQLHVQNTQAMVEKHVPFVPGSYPAAGAAVGATHGPEDVSGLSD
jgi:fructose/tagatose bisphosphate aldolase